MNVVVSSDFFAFAPLINDANILDAAVATRDSALLNALINPVTPFSPRVVNAELKEVIPLVSRPTIPLAILTRRFVWVITLDSRVVSIPLILL